MFLSVVVAQEGVAFEQISPACFFSFAPMNGREKMDSSAANKPRDKLERRGDCITRMGLLYVKQVRVRARCDIARLMSALETTGTTL